MHNPSIQLTDGQVDSIFEDFDWWEATKDYIDQEFLNEYLNSHPDMLEEYLDYGISNSVAEEVEAHTGWVMANGNF